MTGDYFNIVIDLPKTNEQGEVILTDGQPTYEINYFCGLEKHPVTKNYHNIWDTDYKYRRRFTNHAGAENYKRLIIDPSIDGARVVAHEYFKSIIH